MKVKLTIGDWSKDGHNQSEMFYYESNKTVEEIQQAYKDSCKLTGLSFNHNEDYTELGLKWGHPEYDLRKICTEYGDASINKFSADILLKYGIDVKEYKDEEDNDEDSYYVSLDKFPELVIAFIKLSLPDLVLTEASVMRTEINNLPAINGWWNKNLNVQFGYGLFE